MNKINYAELRDNIQYHSTPTPPFKAYFDSEIESEKLSYLTEIMNYFHFISQIYQFPFEVIKSDFSKICQLRVMSQQAFDSGNEEKVEALHVKQIEIIDKFNSKYTKKLGFDMTNSYSSFEMHKVISKTATRKNFIKNYYIHQIVTAKNIIVKDPHLLSLFKQACEERGVSFNTIKDWFNAFRCITDKNYDETSFKNGYVKAYRQLENEVVAMYDTENHYSTSNDKLLLCIKDNYIAMFRNKVEPSFNLDKLEFLPDIYFIKGCMSVALNQYQKELLSA